MNLRSAARRVDPHVLIAQRLKRLPSIVAKLQRFDKMMLSRMQDLGGCRAVLGTVDQVLKLFDRLQKSKTKNELCNTKNYIESPELSGYRGIHLIYKYRSPEKPKYDGLRVEVQIRTRIQHAWATAVETVGTFTRQALKSSQGSEKWLRFFSLASSAFALRENQAPVPGTPTDEGQLIAELRELTTSLRVFARLSTFQAAVGTTMDAKTDLPGDFYLISLDADTRSVDVSAFRRSDQAAAEHAYLTGEIATRQSGNRDLVLVSADSLQSLRRAYPNYFLDTTVFLRELAIVLKGQSTLDRQTRQLLTPLDLDAFYQKARSDGGPSAKLYQVTFALAAEADDIFSEDPAPVPVEQVISELVPRMFEEGDFISLADEVGRFLQFRFEAAPDLFWIEVPDPGRPGSYGKHVGRDELVQILTAMPRLIDPSSFPDFKFRSWDEELTQMSGIRSSGQS